MSSSRSDGVLVLVAVASGLRDALALAGAGDALVLLEDAVPLALAASTAGAPLDAPRGVALAVLGPDLEARGLAGKPLRAGIATIDYAGLVELAAVQRASVSFY